MLIWRWFETQIVPVSLPIHLLFSCFCPLTSVNSWPWVSGTHDGCYRRGFPFQKEKYFSIPFPQNSVRGASFQSSQGKMQSMLLVVFTCVMSSISPCALASIFIFYPFIYFTRRKWSVFAMLCWSRFHSWLLWRLFLLVTCPSRQVCWRRCALNWSLVVVHFQKSCLLACHARCPHWVCWSSGPFYSVHLLSQASSSFSLA